MPMRIGAAGSWGLYATRTVSSAAGGVDAPLAAGCVGGATAAVVGAGAEPAAGAAGGGVVQAARPAARTTNTRRRMAWCIVCISCRPGGKELFATGMADSMVGDRMLCGQGHAVERQRQGRLSCREAPLALPFNRVALPAQHP